MTLVTRFSHILARQRRARWPVWLVTGVVALNGIVAILDILYAHLPRLNILVPFDYDYYSRLSGIFAGFLLLYFAGQLALRKRLAWWMAFVASVVIVLDSALHARNPFGLLLPVVTLVTLAWYQSSFEVKVEWRSVATGLRLLVLCLVVALAYGSIGFTRLAPRDFDTPHRASLAEGAKRTVEEFTLVGNDDLSPHSRRVHWFIDSLDLLGSLSIAFAFYSLFRPLAYRYATLPAERQRAGDLIRRYGTSSEDAFKLWPEDKAYFFGSGGVTVLSYRVDHGCALVLGTPVGPEDQWKHTIAEFKQFCHEHDWTVTFMYVPETALEIFEAAHLRPLKIGEDAIVTTTTFASTTIRSKHWRGVMNKFARLEYQFEVVEAPQTAAILHEAAAVTKAWLGVDGRKERGFALGYHDRVYLAANRLYVVRDKDGMMVAFANGIHSYNDHESTIDLMRYRPDSETGVMDFMLASIITALATNGVTQFSLGLAPLAGVGTGPEQTPEERLIALAGRLGAGGFAFEGLRRFKHKFDPTWEARYLVYGRGPAGLTRTFLAINSLMGG